RSLFLPRSPSVPPVSSLPLHDALPICRLAWAVGAAAAAFLFLAGTGLSLGGVLLGARPRNAPPAAPRTPGLIQALQDWLNPPQTDRKSTRLNSSHGSSSYAVFCLKKKN